MGWDSGARRLGGTRHSVEPPLLTVDHEACVIGEGLPTKKAYEVRQDGECVRRGCEFDVHVPASRSRSASCDLPTFAQEIVDVVFQGLSGFAETLL